MEQSPFWEADQFSASQEIFLILQNVKACHCIHKSPPPVPILSPISPFHAPPPFHFLKIHFNIIVPSTPRYSKWSISLSEFLKNYGASCRSKFSSPVLHNHEKQCIALFWNMTQYSLVQTVRFFGTLIATYWSTLRHSPLGNDMNAHSCKDLKLCTTDQQLNFTLENSCYQSPQPYSTTSSPPQLLAHRHPQPHPCLPHRQQLQWLRHYYIYVVQ